MNRSDYENLVSYINEKRMALSGGKSKDYATEDTLSNFKRMNRMCKELDIDVRRSPADNARYLLLLKLDRWCNLAKKGTQPQNEAVVDTVMDALNYINLAYACEVDTEQEKYEEFMRDHRSEIDNDDYCNKPESDK